MPKLKRRPSPALVISLVALFVALGSGAYAASKIDTQDIKKKAVTTPKLDVAAVTGKKVAEDAIKSAKIKDETLKTDDYGPGTVTNDKLTHPTYWAEVDSNGSLLASSSGVTDAQRTGTGTYTVVPPTLDPCSFQVTGASLGEARIGAARLGPDFGSPAGASVYVQLRNTDGVRADGDFYLAAHC